VQTTGFSWAGDLAGPDVQATRLLTMDAQLLEAFLQPLPVLLAFLFGECCGSRVFLRVALEDARADQEDGVVYGMYQRFDIVQDEFSGSEAVFELGHEMLGGWGRM